MKVFLTFLAALCIAVIVAGCDGPQMSVGEMEESIVNQLRTDSPDSDAAVILTRAMETGIGKTPEQRRAIYTAAISQADEARNFNPTYEAPLPQGWPKPSLPGLVRIKKYPAVRAAWASEADSRDGQFMTLFKYIKTQGISMTAPVVMQYTPQADEFGVPQATAFLYEMQASGNPGSFGQVQVTDEPAMTVVSVGVKGAYTSDEYQKMFKQLRAWLAENEDWQQDGPLRVLAYNSPFIPFWMKYSEAQMEVKMISPAKKMQTAIFAGGCFWGMQKYMEEQPGVLKVLSGYTGGNVAKPTYEQVCTGKTGHAEAVEVTFDPAVISYEQLAKVFFEIHDPTQLNYQGPDVGEQYRSAVFYMNDGQKQVALKLIKQLRSLGYDVVTQVLPAGEFYPAEEYHQDFMRKNPGRYICHSRVKRFPATKPQK